MGSLFEIENEKELPIVVHESRRSYDVADAEDAESLLAQGKHWMERGPAEGTRADAAVEGEGLMEDPKMFSCVSSQISRTWS